MLFLPRLHTALLGVATVACLAVAGAAPAWAQAAGVKRVALVIGNSAYKEQPLKNPANDAKAMAAKLRQIGFQVIERQNATKTQMEKSVADFGEALNAGAIGLFYYAGHGLQVGGRNFLVPVDASITSEQRVRLETVDVDVVLDQMEAAKSGVNLVILDACRNNPFERRFRAAGGGLAQINAPQGTLIAYATAPGKVAADGDGANGLYTAKLLQHSCAPGVAVEEIFKRVRVDVSRETNADQTPWESSSLIGSFTFVDAPPPASAPPPQQVAAAPAASAVDREALFWQSAKDSDDPGVLQSYLTQYPNGTFAPLAKAKIAAVERRGQEAQRPPAPQLAAAPVPAPVPGGASRDGRWTGSDGPWTIDVQVAGDKILGTARAPGRGGGGAGGTTMPFNATIDPSGAVSGYVSVSSAARWDQPIQVSGQFPALQFKAGAGSGARITLQRVRDEAQAAAQAAAVPAPAAAPQVAAAPAPSAPRALTPGNVDGTWQGSYSCSASNASGQPAFDNPGRVFQVRDGKLTGRFMPGGPNSGNGTEEYAGTIAADGTVTITGEGSNPKGQRPYAIRLQGKAADGRFTATGKHGDRDCTLTYAKIR